MYGRNARAIELQQRISGKQTSDEFCLPKPRATHQHEEWLSWPHALRVLLEPLIYLRECAENKLIPAMSLPHCLSVGMHSKILAGLDHGLKISQISLNPPTKPDELTLRTVRRHLRSAHKIPDPEGCHLVVNEGLEVGSMAHLSYLRCGDVIVAREANASASLLAKDRETPVGFGTAEGEVIFVWHVEAAMVQLHEGMTM
jgi:hypothetical protein